MRLTILALLISATCFGQSVNNKVILSSNVNSFNIDSRTMPYNSVVMIASADSTKVSFVNTFTLLSSTSIDAVVKLRPIAKYCRSDSNSFASYVALRVWCDSFMFR